MPAISVLLPCYNCAGTLDSAFESLARQTLPDFEIVAVDDGSSDDTLQILKAWVQREPRLRILRQPHGGILQALNVGLQACSSEYIARMDADDLCRPERLMLQAAYLNAHPEIDVVGCRVAGFPPEQVREGFRIYLTWLNSLLDDADIRRELFVESPLVHPSVTFRRHSVERVGGYEERGWPEDYDLWMRLYLAGARFARLPEVLLDWRDEPQRLTRTDPRYSLENFLRLKAYYLARGPLAGRDALAIWGAGMVGRRLSKHLIRQGTPLEVFFDVDLRKVGRTRRGFPILPPEDLPGWWGRFEHPALLVAVGARGARPIIRPRLDALGLVEGRDWWFAA